MRATRGRRDVAARRELRDEWLEPVRGRAPDHDEGFVTGYIIEHGAPRKRALVAGRQRDHRVALRWHVARRVAATVLAEHCAKPGTLGAVAGLHVVAGMHPITRRNHDDLGRRARRDE